MTTAPRISIVLPVYNGSRYLDESVQSCVDQTYADWELILVDDCSTDATGKIIRKWLGRDRRIRSTRNETNRKLPGSLNVGFALAMGDYFTWTSHDNIYLPTALAEMADALDRRAEIDLVYCDCLLINPEGVVTGKTELKGPDQLPFGNCVGACFLYRRGLHDALDGYDESCFLSEDYDFWLRAFARGSRLFHHRKLLYQCRLHEDSLTERFFRENKLTRFEVKRRTLPQITRLDGRQMAEAFLALCTDAITLNQRGAARKAILAAIRRYPPILLRRGPLNLLVRGFLGDSGVATLKGILSVFTSLAELLKNILRPTPVYPFLRGIKAELRTRLRERKETRDWIRLGKPAPPPHAVKKKTVREYAERFGIATFVETGTFLGEMTDAVKHVFTDIISIELSPELQQQAEQKFARFPHIRILHGDSADVLPNALATIANPALFWLDAHYSGGWTAKGDVNTPVLTELRHILAHPVKQHVILVDDARSFTGQGDFPTIEELKNLVRRERPDWVFEIKDDIIRIHGRFTETPTPTSSCSSW